MKSHHILLTFITSLSITTGLCEGRSRFTETPWIEEHHQSYNAYGNNDTCDDVCEDNACHDQCQTYYPKPRAHLTLGAEGLIWRINQHNLDYAVDFDPDDELILGDGETRFMEFDWRGGVRGYIGLSNAGWSLRGIYTYYTSDLNAKIDTTDLEFSIKASLLHPSTEFETAEIATAYNNVNYQTGDVIIGKFLGFCNNNIILYPYFGVKGLKLDQTIHVTYEGEDFITPERVHWNSDLEAGGANIGLDALFRWCGNFGVFGDMSTSILTSKTDVHHIQETIDNDDNVTATLINLEEHQWITIPGLHLRGGFSWDGHCGRCFYYRLKLACEFNHWFNIPMIRRYSSGNNGVSHCGTNGHLGLYGGTLGLDLIF